MKMPSLTEQSARLMAENAQLRLLFTFADKRVKALTLFASRSGNALWLSACRPTDCTPVIKGVDTAVLELTCSFPSLEDLITAHEDAEQMKVTSKMAEWVAGEDQVQIEQEQRLKGDRDLR